MYLVMELLRLIKMYLNMNCPNIQVGKFFCDKFTYWEWGEKGDTFSWLLFNFAAGYAIKDVQTHQEGVKLSVTHQIMFYAYDAD